MRLRNIPASVEAIENSPICIKQPETRKGQWKLSLSDNRPIQIEIGMGKGQFITQLALDENDEIIGYKYLNFGKMMDFIKAGDDAVTAVEKASGQYGRVADAVKLIDPRKE